MAPSPGSRSQAENDDGARIVGKKEEDSVKNRRLLIGLICAVMLIGNMGAVALAQATPTKAVKATPGQAAKLMLLPKFLAGFSGQYVDAYGYSNFFVATALLGVPVLLLVWLASNSMAGRRTAAVAQAEAH